MANKAPGTIIGQVDQSDSTVWNGRMWVPYGTGTAPQQQQQGENPQQTAGSGAADRQANAAQAQQVAGAVRGKVVGVLTNALNTRRPDNTQAAAQRALAEESQKGAMELRADQQRHQQLANRDPRVEGDKDAATRAASQFGQKMSQISGAAGGGAAALASMNVQDPSAAFTEHRNRADHQQERGEEVGVAARSQQEEVINRRAFADEIARREHEKTVHNNAARNLSLGGNTPTEEPLPTEEPPAAETPAETQTTPAAPGPQPEAPTPEPTTPEPEAAPEPAPVEPPPVDEKLNARIQNALSDAGLDASGTEYQNLYKTGLEIAKRAQANPNDLEARKDWELLFKEPVDNLGKTQKKYTAVSKDPLKGISTADGKTEINFDPNQGKGSDVRIKNIISAIHRRF